MFFSNQPNYIAHSIKFSSLKTLPCFTTVSTTQYVAGQYYIRKQKGKVLNPIRNQGY